MKTRKSGKGIRYASAIPLGVLAGVSVLLIANSLTWLPGAIRQRVEEMQFQYMLAQTQVSQGYSMPNSGILKPTPTPLSQSNPSATFIPSPTLDAYTIRMNGEVPLFEEHGLTAGQMDTYLNMGLEEKQAFYGLADVGGEDVDFYSLRLTPDSLTALWSFLQGFSSDARKAVLMQPNSPIKMMGSGLYVLNTSDNSTPYFAALASDVLEEKFGLRQVMQLDNAEAGTTIDRLMGEAYSSEFSLGRTVDDRVQQILDYRNNPDSWMAASLTGRWLQQYIDDYGLPILRNASLDQTRTAILELERLRAGSGEDGPLTLYFISHTGFDKSGNSVLFVNSGLSQASRAEQLFPPEFFQALGGRHVNFVFSACPFNLISGFKQYLDNQGVSYTILTSYVDTYTYTPLGNTADALEIVTNLEPENRHPYVPISLLQQVAEGKAVNDNVSVLDMGDRFRYMFWPYEIRDGVESRWQVDGGNKMVYAEIFHNYNDGKHTTSFSPVLLTSPNLQYQDQMPLFGLNLKRMP